MRATTKLYHYTCTHRWDPIRRSRLLQPNRHPYLAEPLVWLTDMRSPNREGLGLTSQILDCDRTEVRIPVEIDYAVHWPAYADAIGVPAYVRLLFCGSGTLPGRWWVTTAPIPLTRAEVHEATTYLRRRS